MKRAVDFDATLAFYEEFEGPAVLGDPIPKMVERVQGWLDDGDEVVILTARVFPGKPGSPEDAEIAREAIRLWCIEYIGQELEVTCIKDPDMEEIWDDRAIRIEENAGEIDTSKPKGAGVDIIQDMEW